MHTHIGPILQHNLLKKCMHYHILAEGILLGVYAAYVTYVCACATYLFVIVYTSTHPCRTRSPKKPTILVDPVRTSLGCMYTLVTSYLYVHVLYTLHYNFTAYTHCVLTVYSCYCITCMYTHVIVLFVLPLLSIRLHSHALFLVYKCYQSTRCITLPFACLYHD